ncbi:hypothetical protein ACHAWF_001959 [Thalassiosira exigua]
MIRSTSVSLIVILIASFAFALRQLWVSVSFNGCWGLRSESDGWAWELPMSDAKNDGEQNHNLLSTPDKNHPPPANLFPPAEPYVFWSSDFHISPIADVKDLFKAWDETKHYRIIDESLSGHCGLMGTCMKDLRVLDQGNGIPLPCPNDLKRKFWEAYKNDERMQSVDVFFAHHAFGLAELYMAFGRPIIAVASTRYEIGRHAPPRWNRLNANMRSIASNPRNTIAANNVYDAE